MNNIRHDDKTDNMPQSAGTDKPAHDAKDLLTMKRM